MTQKKQSTVGFEGSTVDTIYTRIISLCTRLAVKLATYLRGLA